jgi:PhnB protein
MPKTIIQPYLTFDGRCEEAIEFYHSKLGAEVVMKLRFKESPEPPPPGMLPPNWEDKIMHCSFKIGESLVMASDGGCHEKKGFNGFSLSLSLQNEAAATKAFNALAEGGNIGMPLAKTFWSPCFGMVTDRFGLNWMVTVEMQQA